MYRNNKIFLLWELTSIFMQTMWVNFLLFCTPTWRQCKPPILHVQPETGKILGKTGIGGGASPLEGQQDGPSFTSRLGTSETSSSTSIYYSGSDTCFVPLTVTLPALLTVLLIPLLSSAAPSSVLPVVAFRVGSLFPAALTKKLNHELQHATNTILIGDRTFSGSAAYKSKSLSSVPSLLLTPSIKYEVLKCDQ